MPWNKKNRPTNKELTVLGILWERGPCTVRQVHDILEQGKDTSYTTTLKLMQLMLEKGLLTRDTSRRSHIYDAATNAEQGQGYVLDDVIDRVFSGSAQRMLMRALSKNRMSREELVSLKKLLNKMEPKS